MDHGRAAGSDAVLDGQGFLPDDGAIGAVEAEGAKGAEVADDMVAIDHGRGRGEAVEVMDRGRCRHADEFDLVDQFPGFEIDTKRVESDRLLGLELLELLLLDPGSAHDRFRLFLGGDFFDRRRHPHLTIHHHGRGPALAGKLRFPRHVLRLAPLRGGRARSVAVAVRSAKLRPGSVSHCDGSQTEGGEGKEKEEAEMHGTIKQAGRGEPCGKLR